MAVYLNQASTRASPSVCPGPRGEELPVSICWGPLLPRGLARLPGVAHQLQAGRLRAGKGRGGLSNASVCLCACACISSSLSLYLSISLSPSLSLSVFSFSLCVKHKCSPKWGSPHTPLLWFHFGSGCCVFGCHVYLRGKTVYSCLFMVVERTHFQKLCLEGNQQRRSKSSERTGYSFCPRSKLETHKTAACLLVSLETTLNTAPPVALQPNFSLSARTAVDFPEHRSGQGIHVFLFFLRDKPPRVVCSSLSREAFFATYGFIEDSQKVTPSELRCGARWPKGRQTLKRAKGLAQALEFVHVMTGLSIRRHLLTVRGSAFQVSFSGNVCSKKGVSSQKL